MKLYIFYDFLDTWAIICAADIHAALVYLCAKFNLTVIDIHQNEVIVNTHDDIGAKTVIVDYVEKEIKEGIL